MTFSALTEFVHSSVASSANVRIACRPNFLCRPVATAMTLARISALKIIVLV